MDGDDLTILLPPATAARPLGLRIVEFARRARAVVEMSEVEAIGGLQIVVSRGNVATLATRIEAELRAAGCEVATA